MTPNETAERAAFEAWFFDEVDPEDIADHRRAKGDYGGLFTPAGAAWDAWKERAARAASPVTPQEEAVASPAVSAAEGEAPIAQGWDVDDLCSRPTAVERTAQEVRLRRVTRFALHRFAMDARFKADAAAQDKEGRYFPPGSVEALLRDAEDAEAARALLSEATPSPRDCDSPASGESALVVAARKACGQYFQEDGYEVISEYEAMEALRRALGEA